MAGETTVQLVGAEKLQAKLGRVLEPIEQGLAQLAEYVRQEAKTRAKPHAADKGTLGNVIKVSFAGKGMALSAIVAPPRSVVGIALSVEEGRGPGRPPPVKAIGRWAEAHGIATKPWLLAQYIKKHGTKGIHFMAGAAEAGEKKAHDICQAAAIKIEENWGK
jgi:hypothetical protein